MSSSTATESVLHEAWRRFAVYDLNAVALQRRFLRARTWAAALGVVATLLAVTYAALPRKKGEEEAQPIYERVLRLLVIATPIAGGVLAAGLTKLDRGQAWIHLRGSAESLKREIYRYRTRVGPYSAAHTATRDREKKLVAKFESLARRMLDSEVAVAGLKTYDDAELPPKNAVAPADDGFSDLSAERYLEVRLEDQLAYYRKKSRLFERQHRIIRWTIAGLGGLGTFLAAVGLEIWIPVSISTAGALGAYLELRRVETWLEKYSRAVVELENVASWWATLSPEERAREEAREHLVSRTETVLKSENSDWQSEMQESIDELRDEAMDWWKNV